jgi:hypothetical protein
VNVLTGLRTKDKGNNGEHLVGFAGEGDNLRQDSPFYSVSAKQPTM